MGSGEQSSATLVLLQRSQWRPCRSSSSSTRRQEPTPTGSRCSGGSHRRARSMMASPDRDMREPLQRPWSGRHGRRGGGRLARTAAPPASVPPSPSVRSRPILTSRARRSAPARCPARAFGASGPARRGRQTLRRALQRRRGSGLQMDSRPRPSPPSPTWLTAWDVVHLADRSNAGTLVDLSHHRRGSNDDDALRAVNGSRVYSVQLSDGRRLVGPPLEDVNRTGPCRVTAASGSRPSPLARRARRPCAERHRGVRTGAPRCGRRKRPAPKTPWRRRTSPRSSPDALSAPVGQGGTIEPHRAPSRERFGLFDVGIEADGSR